MSRRYQARPKIHVKRVFFSQLSTVLRNVNRVSSLCKIGLKGYDFRKIIYVFRVVFHTKCVYM